ncbi:MAG: MerR family transcriptional regulator [Dehalococcoidia bacterium]|nr:MerR family transcriptional regulator [Dehalococcoidia bacterium]
MGSEREPRYVISIAARMVGVGTHTLRYYERMGLVEPERSPGGLRLYSEREVERLRHVKTLMDDLGINLAGVEVVLRLMERLASLQREMEEIRKQMGGNEEMIP